MATTSAVKISAPASGASRVATQIGSSFLALAIALGAWEVILRAFVAQNPGARSDPVRGVVRGAGVTLQTEEGSSRTVFDSNGIRLSPPPAPGAKIRILAVGDSFTEGLQVADDETFCFLLQKRLRQDGFDAEVVNAGILGGAPAVYEHEADFLKSRYRPTLTVLQVNEGDFKNELFDPSKTFYYKNDSGRLRVVENHHLDSGSALAARLQKFHVPTNWSVVYLGALRLKDVLIRHSDGGDAAKAPASGAAAPEDGAAAADTVLARMKAIYANPVVVYIPWCSYLDRPETPDAYDRAIEAAGQKNCLDLLSMRSTFVSEFERSHRPSQGFDNTNYEGFGHINALGHALIAQRLVPAVEQRLLAAGFKKETLSR